MAKAEAEVECSTGQSDMRRRSLGLVPCHGIWVHTEKAATLSGADLRRPSNAPSVKKRVSVFVLFGFEVREPLPARAWL